MKKPKLRREKGQSLIVVAFGIMTLIGFAGLAIDLGLSYMERIKARRAADAASLAAAAELPLEDAAHIRALEFLDENDYGCNLQVDPVASGYRCTETTEVRLEVNGTYISGPSEDAAERVIRINTADYRDPPTLADSASRIRVEVEQKAPVYFMRVFGFDDVPVRAHAIAENINNLDIALVFDRSGSMEFDTLCFGCWTPNSNPYPDGNINPLNWDGDLDGTPDHCEGNSPNEYDGYTYIVIEAEEYSYISNPYNRELYTNGYTYWVLQRNGGRYVYNYGVPSYLRDSDGAGSLGRDDLGGYLSHLPPRTHLDADGMGVPCTWDDINDGGMCRRSAQLYAWGGPFPAPRADYDFTIPHSDNWYVWFRGQGGDHDHIFWGLNGAPIGQSDAYESSDYTNGAERTRWGWKRAGCGEHDDQPCAQGLNAGANYTLNFWAGGDGFDLDRIVITDDPRDPDDFFYRNDTDPYDSYDDLVDDVLNGPATSVADNNRTGWACDPCDARFGGSPSPSDPRRPVCTAAMAPQPYRYLDDIYDDEQPIRASVEAAKTFVRRLDPRYDQIGYIRYNSSAQIVDRLECVRRRGIDDCAEGWVEDSGFSSDIIENTIVRHLDETHASGGTNIGHGIMLGVEVLSNRVINGHQNYGRPGAAHIMIVMTDGRTNQLNGVDQPACYAEDLWPANDTGNTTWDRAKDCAVYYAMEARNNGIVIYTITLGNTADIELMSYIADVTGGVHRHAPRPEQLTPIFDELYKRIFLRIVE